MLRVIIEVEGVAQDMTPLQFVEKYVLSPDLIKGWGNVDNIPVIYDNVKALDENRMSLVQVRIMDITQK